MNNKTTITAEEAAKYIGISYWGILELTKKRKIPFVLVGRRKLFRKDTLDKWMAEQEEISTKLEIAASDECQDYGTLRKIY